MSYATSVANERDESKLAVMLQEITEVEQAAVDFIRATEKGKARDIRKIFSTIPKRSFLMFAIFLAEHANGRPVRY